jgi:hypothetical protein
MWGGPPDPTTARTAALAEYWKAIDAIRSLDKGAR